MCGEKYPRSGCIHSCSGSPPHVRGKGGVNRYALKRAGITPACAGKRVIESLVYCVDRDHPRMCGEKLLKEQQLKDHPGITPACAGKRGEYGGQTHRPQDHPRMCGEKLYFPPLAFSLIRITPACAGKSTFFLRAGFASGDHPRMCGEKDHHQIAEGPCEGSPPHVRGKAERRDLPVGGYGITPACAGKRLKRSRSTVTHAAIVPLFPSVCNKPAGSDGSPAGHDAPPFLPIENAAPASPTYNLRSL